MNGLALPSNTPPSVNSVVRLGRVKSFRRHTGHDICADDCDQQQADRRPHQRGQIDTRATASVLIALMRDQRIGGKRQNFIEHKTA